MRFKNSICISTCVTVCLVYCCTSSFAQSVFTEKAKAGSGEATIAKMVRIGVPAKGFVWSEPMQIVEEGETMIAAYCRKDGSDDYVTLLVLPENVIEQSDRWEIGKGALDGTMRMLRNSGVRGQPDIKGPDQNKEIGESMKYTIDCKDKSSDKRFCSAIQVRFKKITYAVTAYGESLETVLKLSDVIEKAQVLDGKEFDQALASLRRFRSPELGFSIAPPLNMQLKKNQKQCVEFRGLEGVLIRVRGLPVDKKLDFDANWKQVGQVPTGAVAADESDAKINGFRARFKTYTYDTLHGNPPRMVEMLKKGQNNPDDNELWGTSWLFQDGENCFEVKAHCFKRDMDSKSEAILNAIREIKPE